jgi:hypothetical protein
MRGQRALLAANPSACSWANACCNAITNDSGLCSVPGKMNLAFQHSSLQFLFQSKTRSLDLNHAAPMCAHSM